MNFIFKWCYLVLLICFNLETYSQSLAFGKVKKTIEINGIPSFFFKVKSDGSMISYTISKANTGGSGTNYLIDTETKKITKVPGVWDPVFIYHSNLMILPMTAAVDDYRIFNVENLLTDDQPESLIKLENFSGYYQSTGELGPNAKNPESSKCYRIIAESRIGKHIFTDICLEEDSDHIEIKTPSTIFCQNFKLKLPMLSKTGKLLGAFDTQTKTSGVFRIEDNGSCHKVMDLGIKTGKLNFNKHETLVAYHLSHNREQGDVTAEDYVAVPGKNYVSDIYLRPIFSDIEAIKVTNNLNVNSMYPDFTDDGQLVFINHPHDGNQKVSFTFLSLIPNLNEAKQAKKLRGKI
ncbi:MAG: hypothetical protein QE271_10000 [Bacteriovoracaceae bacterium]|nr:hypothetical protein [Bacteriovoracaceae bacterium]